jgi:hypothetical protein
MHAIFDHGSPPPCPAPFNLAAYVLGHASTLSGKISLSVIAPDSAEPWIVGASPRSKWLVKAGITAA